MKNLFSVYTIISGLSKSLNVANKAIPIIKEMKPILGNITPIFNNIKKLNTKPNSNKNEKKNPIKELPNVKPNSNNPVFFN